MAETTADDGRGGRGEAGRGAGGAGRAGGGRRDGVHPGAGRRATRLRPRGRPVEPEALAEVQALLGDRPRRADLLIEHLHLIQDRYHHLAARHLAALAHEMRLALAEVYEVATFYAHFDVVAHGEAPPPPVTLRVCDGLSCELAGAQELLAALPSAVGPGVRVVKAPCMGACHRAPAAALGHALHEHVTVDGLAAAARAAAADGAAGHAPAGGTTTPAVAAGPGAAGPVGLAAYQKGGGYALLRACLDGRRDVEDVLKPLEDAGLRGLGGAGFPTGRKWRMVREQPAPRLMAVNADEGEPGTFKDRHCLETDPHRFLEGMLLGAWVTEATDVYVYLRDEYPHLRPLLAEEIAALEQAGLAPHTRVHLRRGAGAYICGEESAMLESIEGRRGLPRHKPPFPSQVGLFGRPTLINNVETLYWARDVIERGPSWWSGFGRHGRTGLKSYSVSGRVKEPGVKLAPAGITLRELIAEHCGGMADGHELAAYLPGGASGGLLPAGLADVPLDFGTLEEHGCFIGSAAVVVLSDKDDLRAVALNLLRFFEDESCGQCTPCRVGTAKAVKLLEREVWDTALLEELRRAMADASICGLGQAAMNPVRQIITHFPEVVAAGGALTANGRADGRAPGAAGADGAGGDAGARDTNEGGRP